MTNYKESTSISTQWTRCARVFIENPLDGVPGASFVEEVAVRLSEQTITRLSGNLTVTFNQDNPKHVQAYNLLNEIYMEAALARDANIALVE